VATDGENAARREIVKQAANTMATMLNSVLRVHKTRPWGIQSGGRFYTNAINDLAIVGLFKPGPRQASTPSVSQLEGHWEPF
jgi:hypothetical protein